MNNNAGEYLEATLSKMCVCKSPVGLKAEHIGSCVGVMLWDSQSGIGGLVEIMQSHSKGNVSMKEVGMYADTGIVELIRRMELQGAKKKNIHAKIAGGANMKELAHISEIAQTGIQNVVAVKQILQEQDISIVGEDVGMDVSRTIYFMPEDGRCKVVVQGLPGKEI